MNFFLKLLCNKYSEEILHYLLLEAINAIHAKGLTVGISLDAETIASKIVDFLHGRLQSPKEQQQAKTAINALAEHATK